MKIPPKKPHFFKYIQPCLGGGVRIPKAFFNYIRGENLEQAMLRRGNQKWPVKINDGLFENGWTKFACDNKVEEGYFLVFRHEGHMVFDVMIFEPSSYEKEYQIPVAPCSPSEAKETIPTPSTKEYKFNVDVLLQPIQAKFARLHGLSYRHCEIILMFENQTSWPATLRYKGSTSLIGRGCREFFIGNGIKEGESFKLELIKNGKKPIFNFSRLKKKMKITTCNQGKAINNSTPDGHLSYFESTLTRYNITNSVLYLPNKFTRTNGLSNGVMILRDEKQRSWPVEMRDAGSYVYIGHGWSDFCIANDLNEGDSFKFELIKKGNKPIVKFTYDELPTCKALWEQLKFSFGGTSTTRLRSLVIKFEEYTKDPKHTMSEHLRVMSNMIGKLREAGHALTDEQQVRAVIRSFPASWANMKQILTHSENVKNFSDVSQHVILEAETRDADKTLTYVAQEGPHNALGVIAHVDEAVAVHCENTAALDF
ncbi:hypothetical protein RJ640_024815, partial [Escallonia rubra]